MEISILNNTCSLIFDEKIYPIKILMKAGYIFIDILYIYFESVDEGNGIKINFTGKKIIEEDKFKEYIGEFYNELLHQRIRNEIQLETKITREIILGRALYGTAINHSNLTKEENNGDCSYKDDSYKIGEDWFETE